MTTETLREILKKNKNGEATGIYSVCSAHPLVLEASMLEAAERDSALLIESTSNQVDQFGGYTGMTPADFRDFVHEIADEVGYPRARVILGGDHLGPNRWQKEEPETAMVKALDLVVAYVEAGFTKIHLDCSMSCKGDPVPLTDEIVAERAARMMVAAESAAAEAGIEIALDYVVGTEVPVPGGAHETLDELQPTPRAAAEETIEAHKRAFADAGLERGWDNVVALVVQPAVEFDHVQVIDYVSSGTKDLQRALEGEEQLLFEAHSTDYQTQEALTGLVKDGWAILKVGPGLTFNLREALLALDLIEAQLVSDADKRARIADVLEEVMLDDPGYWQGYYEGTEEEQRLARRFSYSDRVRYYLPNPKVVAALETLFTNLDEVGIPEPLISQYLPKQFDRVREGELRPTARDLAIDRVRDAIRPYANACGQKRK